MSDKYHDTVAASSVTTDDGQVKAARRKSWQNTSRRT